MHKGFCQSVKGLKKSFDAEIGDTVSTVKTEIVYHGKQGQKTNELMKEIGGYFEEKVITMSEAEYDALTAGKKGWFMPETARQAIKTALTVMQDLLSEEDK